MRIGIPKEVKDHEYRVGMTPPGVFELTQRGHEVIVENDAGHAIGIDNPDYENVGATIGADAAEIFSTADMIVKVKEPQADEIGMLREGQLLFTYLHLAPDQEQTQGLLDSGAIAIAYETVTDDFGALPLLAPMSEVAGRMSVQAGASGLEIERGGRGVLLGGVPGVPQGKVVVIGGGVVGTNAAFIANGMGASVTVIDKAQHRMAELDFQFQSLITTLYSTTHSIEEAVLGADLVIGAVLVPGAAAPKLVTREMVRAMKRGSVIVDVAIDQGGCIETSHPTTHSDPYFVEEGVVHYCVTNMPGAMARTSTFALNNATLPFIVSLAEQGAKDAMLANPHLMAGLNVYQGKLTYQAVADAQGQEHTDAAQLLAGS
ncbi:MAG: alanine dehydrogenase [Rhodospirillaceae bacterium]|nr:alanine dehydrogenase [Rhodospirillaceae bacterium]|tara:strand:+ start:52306 stop:53427 length:1122 start_codon:yes stop_codon:yes gene_type:complete